MVITGRTRNAFAGEPARGFESHLLRHIGDIAQLVERCVRNAEARGSSPLISTKALTDKVRAFCFMLLVNISLFVVY